MHPIRSRVPVSLLLAAVVAATPIGPRPAHAAVPGTVSFSARLVDGAAVVDGEQDFTFRLYAAGTGSDPLWEETQHLTARQGLVFASLGAATTLDTDVLSGQARFLEIQIGDRVLSPRVAVQSVPYAMRAGIADQIGDLTPDQIQPRIDEACDPGSYLTAIDPDGSVICRADTSDISAVAAGHGLTGGGASGDVSLAVDSSYVQRRVATGCAEGWSIRSIDSAGGVTCEHDDVAGDITGVIAGAGLAGGATTGEASLAIDASYVQRRVTGTCGDREMIRSIDPAGGVACGADNDTRYTAGAGLVLNGTVFGAAFAGSGSEYGTSTSTARADHLHDGRYAVRSGAAGGQALVGGTANGEDLTLRSTSATTKGDVLLADTGGNVGIGTTAPTSRLHVAGDLRVGNTVVAASGVEILRATRTLSLLNGAAYIDVPSSDNAWTTVTDGVYDLRPPPPLAGATRVLRLVARTANDCITTSADSVKFRLYFFAHGREDNVTYDGHRYWGQLHHGGWDSIELDHVEDPNGGQRAAQWHLEVTASGCTERVKNVEIQIYDRIN